MTHTTIRLNIYAFGQSAVEILVYDSILIHKGVTGMTLYRQSRPTGNSVWHIAKSDLDDNQNDNMSNRRNTPIGIIYDRLYINCPMFRQCRGSCS